MHTAIPAHQGHEHVFDQGHALAERSTRVVMLITALTMVVEITAGWFYNSMALLADGWHMSSHALAIGLSALAYAVARRHARDPRFAFGTWKVEVLAGFASAILLLGVAALMVTGSVQRLLQPQPIHYREAIVVAVLGLVVNVVCALVLGRAHHGPGAAHEHDHPHDAGHGGHRHDPPHQHGSAHGHGHGAAHDDLNLRSAYLHVLADAATSVLAIAALTGGLLLGWQWLDPLLGILGAVLVAVWAKGLLQQTGAVLLDREMDHPVVAEIREAVQAPDTRITDLHVWRVGRSAYACALTVISSDAALTVEQLRRQLAVHEEVVHITIELHHGAAVGEPTRA